MWITERQKSIIDLMCNDFNQKHISFKLNISLSLVEKEVKHLKNLYKVETNSGLIYSFLTIKLNDNFGL